MSSSLVPASILTMCDRSGTLTFLDYAPIKNENKTLSGFEPVTYDNPFLFVSSWNEWPLLGFEPNTSFTIWNTSCPIVEAHNKCTALKNLTTLPAKADCEQENSCHKVASKIDIWPYKLANHCHLWKNARDGGSLVCQQANEKQKFTLINYSKLVGLPLQVCVSWIHSCKDIYVSIIVLYFFVVVSSWLEQKNI